MNSNCNKDAASLAVAAILAFCVAAAGCGDGLPTRVPVSGTVLIDGQPLPLGQVMFAPSDDRASIGAIQPDGTFQLTCYKPGDGAVRGTHRVTVTAAEALSETETRWYAPKRYAELATSGLEVTIDGPTDDVVIELSWNGGRPFVERYGM